MRPATPVLLFLAPPSAWAVHLMVVYPLVPWLCSTGQFWLLWLAHLVPIGVAAASAIVAARLSRLGEGNRFLERLAIWGGVFFVFAMSLEALPTLLLDPCR